MGGWTRGNRLARRTTARESGGGARRSRAARRRRIAAAVVFLGAVVVGARVLAGVVVPPVVRALEPDREVAARAVPDDPLHAAPVPARTRERADEPRRVPARALRLDLAPDLAAAVELDTSWIADAIEDLADDDTSWNACGALSRLQRAGDEVIEPLRAVLGSEDHQQRQLAAMALYARPVYRDAAAPDPVLFELAFEALHSDGWPVGDHYSYGLDNEAAAGEFLLAHMPHAAGRLAANLSSPDGQERFLCAYLLARAGDASSLPAVCAVLTEHLRDNRLNADARLACDALYALGDLALPYLAFAADEAGVDDQARGAIAMLLDDIRHPSRTREEWGERRARHGAAVRLYQPGRPRGLRMSIGLNSPDAWDAPSPRRVVRLAPAHVVTPPSSGDRARAR